MDGQTNRTGESTSVMHSPGPWAVSDKGVVYSQPLHRLVQVRMDDGQIASVDDGIVALVYGHHDENSNYSIEANRRLIAAAPELLAAVELALDCAETDSTLTTASIERFRALIAKAKGRSDPVQAEAERDCQRAIELGKTFGSIVDNAFGRKR